MRPTRQGWAIQMAVLTAKRSSCLRRNVGCVLLNERGHVLASGYNGVAAGQPHCNERDPLSLSGAKVFMGGEVIGEAMDPYRLQYPNACPGARASSGTQLDGCQAIHAEQNALLQCRDVYQIDACYVTASPCMTCVKLLLNTSCKVIYFIENYAHADAQSLWKKAGRQWVRITLEGVAL